jgi:arylsulfatase
MEDNELHAKLAELRKKFGAPPNIIHVMFDDTPVGEIGVPLIQKQRGWESPNMHRLAAEVCLRRRWSRSWMSSERNHLLLTERAL